MEDFGFEKMHSFKQKVKELKNKVTNSNSFNKIITKKKQFLDWVEVHPWKTLFIFYFVFVLIKSGITLIAVDPTVPYDEFTNIKMARSFFNNQNFYITGKPSSHYPPLYPIILSPSYIFNEVVTIFSAMRVINTVVSSLIIFPIFFLSKEFLDVKKSFFCSVLISLLPFNTAMTFWITNENLFIPLVAFFSYFLYKSLLEESYKWKIFCGIFLGLCFLTKYLTAALIVATIISFFFISKKQEDSIISKLFQGFKNSLITLVVSGIICLPWFIRNISFFGFSLTGIIGNTSEIKMASNKITAISDSIVGSSNSGFRYILDFIAQVIFHNGYLILGSGIVFFAIGIIFLFSKSMKIEKNKLFIFGSLSLIIAECLVVLTAWHDTGITWKLNGRYVDATIPLIMILGFVILIKCKLQKRQSIITMIAMIPFLLTLIMVEKLIGRCSLSISHIQAFKGISPYSKFFNINNPAITFVSKNIEIFLIILIITITIIFILLLVKKSKKCIIYLVTILVIINTSFALGSSIVSQNFLTKSDIHELGSWMDKNFDDNGSIVLIDVMSINKGNLRHYLGSWINRPLTYNVLNNLSSHNNIYYILSAYNQTDLRNNNYTFVYENYTLIHEKTVSEPLGNFLPGKETWETNVYIYSRV